MFINNRVFVAEFIIRPNRFEAYVNLNGEELIVHVPNTGRCKEILIPGSKVLLREELNPTRKTLYDLIAGYKNDKIINIDSQIPNKVVDEALKNNKIENLIKYNIIQKEKTFGNSRFDFKLSNDMGEDYYLEVKGVTYEVDGKSMFPDAPTERGRKHLLELVEAKKMGFGAGVLFLIQMNNIDDFSPYDDMDGAFGQALRLAYNEGVDIYAYECEVGEKFITLSKSVKVVL
ncbi:DNA/RNA nuclease SfsA [Clostridium tagluense]|uniref:DNA/RNA nuclease SfsA n=1 Tax=Clostridium tagluense TaxID=360422 RepID=UPI001C0AAD72|nr:DNA/RNA nuclease SfsA [Clostridium tagluense]MBU3130618.1 DNA/RNA nuclease SfsA [Clostridium tagluense]MCB2314174.1 DNA/RNA nuclease SfsA [Clostridium tagluense]MCB2318987.1 DNA/RNA nuclease SfsA [Clostridium tagluense]MCB2323893.1 DNA/RNA nuclease SfsA [Clostridium tagluense]MCB2328732.1 DNA/RNA nuclease SfsA [Clostridium tagluense]